MNYLTDDYGRSVISVGSPASVERVKVEYPKLINNLNSLYYSAYDCAGKAVDEAVQLVRDAGITSKMETNSILMASCYGQEPRGSVTQLVLSM